MASIFGHLVASYTITKAAKANSKLLIGLALVSSCLPDGDILFHNFGVPYGSPFGHRGFTHSIFFAASWSGLLLLLFNELRNWKSYLVLFFSTASHGLLDAMTTGGKGVGFFIPFLDDRYFLPWRFIKVSPMSASRFFSEWGWKVLVSEFQGIFLPCLVILILITAARYGNK
ncbi:MAG: metal-dependent hydrolase [Flavobacteriales bacterium]|nr:metal-dependent hydrolase [Flavobacteriales bacterium]